MTASPSVAALAAQVRHILSEGDDEHRVTAAVAAALDDALAEGLEVPAPLRTPDPSHYVMYPLAVADDDSYSIACAVWDVGQRTPIHDHGTWGVIGILSGTEREIRYQLPGTGAPVRLEERLLDTGSVAVCCTSDQDVHEVSAASDEPCIGIHVYGADIGRLVRHSYDPVTGQPRDFVSRWPGR
jgi:predicted metal-dependent enzyme (double-stranded beta helix superfamily)